MCTFKELHSAKSQRGRAPVAFYRASICLFFASLSLPLFFPFIGEHELQICFDILQVLALDPSSLCHWEFWQSIIGLPPVYPNSYSLCNFVAKFIIGGELEDGYSLSSRQSL